MSRLSMLMTIKRVLWMTSLIISLTAIVGLPSANALVLPQDALVLLSEAAVEPCAICAEQERKKAFAILNRTFIPHTVLTTDVGCCLVKGEGSQDLEFSLTCYPPVDGMKPLPEGATPVHLRFRFHTAAQHLVGISTKDFTAAAIADTYLTAAPGTIFEGRLRIIPYTYGDGPAFNFFPQSDTLQIHCMIEEIRIKTPPSGNRSTAPPAVP